MKETGLILSKLEDLSIKYIKPVLTEKIGLYPNKILKAFSKLCLEPYPKTACLNFLSYFVLPYMLTLIPLIYIFRRIKRTRI